jgi:hypothetical protein
MAFLVATLLIHFTEEEAFWAFYRLMETYGMETMFFTALPGPGRHPRPSTSRPQGLID